jgi:hypothetical protein
MITIVLVAVAGVIALVLIVAAMKPDAFRIERTLAIAARPEKLMAILTDLRSQVSWSPFEKDPAMKRNFSGPERGKGAVYEWDGNKKVGAGRIEITDTSPSRVTMQLEMFRPFAANNLVEFTLEPSGTATTVAWIMQGRQPFMAKLMSVFMDCDKMVGKEFEAGLSALKALAEG